MGIFVISPDGHDYELNEKKDENETYKKNKYTIRMDVTMERDMSYEEAEKVIFNALRNVGMIGHTGGIS